MDDRLKAALEEGARNGATEVFELHERYVQAVVEEETRHEQAVKAIEARFADNEKQYKFAQCIISGIINKLDKKE